MKEEKCAQNCADAFGHAVDWLVGWVEGVEGVQGEEEEEEGEVGMGRGWSSNGEE